MIEYVTLQELERRLRSSRRRNVTGACLVSLSREQVWCPIYGTGRRPGTSRWFTVAEPVWKNGNVIGVLQTRLEPLAITEQVPEASAFTRSSTLIVRRDGTILASENHNRGDISTGNLFDSVKVAGITDEVVEQMEECFYGDDSDSFMFEGKGIPTIFPGTIWDIMSGIL